MENILSFSDEPKKRRRVPLVVIIALAPLVIFMIFAVVNISTCPQIPIAPTTSVSIAPDSYRDYPFNVTQLLPLQSGRSIYGSLTSTNGDVIVYGMTSSQFESFVSTGGRSSYFYDSGPVSSFYYVNCGKSCGTNAPVAPLGDDHLVLFNPGQTSITVQITMALYVVAC